MGPELLNNRTAKRSNHVKRSAAAAHYPYVPPFSTQLTARNKNVKEVQIMSSITLGNIFIANGQTQSWITTWNNSGWQGDTFIQPQPLNTGASLVYAGEETVSMNSSGQYSFSYSVKNDGPNSTFYNLQVGNN